jgi:hypothetical protein
MARVPFLSAISIVCGVPSCGRSLKIASQRAIRTGETQRSMLRSLSSSPRKGVARSNAVPRRPTPAGAAQSPV